MIVGFTMNNGFLDRRAFLPTFSALLMTLVEDVI